MEQPFFEERKSASSLQPARRWLAPACFCAGLGMLLYLLVAPGQSGIPGWQPVNGALLATLSGEGELTATPVPSPVANPVSSHSGTTTEAEQLPASQPSPGSTGAHSALLDLNGATAVQLQDLPGIGPSKAQAIVAYRESRSGFQAVEELLQVKGIGPKIYEQIAPLVTIGGEKK